MWHAVALLLTARHQTEKKTAHASEQDYIICLEDGKKFKSLKRHLKSHYDLSPEEYREKWGLPRDYPMVAPAYAEARSNLAKSMGLGQRNGGKVNGAPAPAAAPAVRAAKADSKRGRKAA